MEIVRQKISILMAAIDGIIGVGAINRIMRKDDNMIVIGNMLTVFGECVFEIDKGANVYLYPFFI